MSCFTGYSKMKNNIFNLSDDEIKKYYFEAEKTLDGGVGYYLHVPRTYEEIMDSNFLAKKSVDVANLYYLYFILTMK